VTRPGCRAPRIARALLAGAALSAACGGPERDAGRIEGPARSAELVAAREGVRERAGELLGGVAPARAKQILFGDLHVHTTFSFDAFLYALPLFGGEGAHPPADACDFARYCAGLDFFSLNDHAEGLPPELWAETRRSVRECNAKAGDPAAPDLVAFAGWEWTQVGDTPETHYGHKNVIFPGLADDELPARPIASAAGEGQRRPPGWLVGGAALATRLLGYGAYADAIDIVGRMAKTPDCPRGVDTRELPADCAEQAATPAELFRKLDEWGFESLVIPHGLAWGLHAPPGATLDVQLSRAQHDPARQRLLEVMSGHGNGEEYRSFPAGEAEAGGAPVCPEPTPDFLPCCWRAGEIMRGRCGDLPAAECEARVAEAQRLTLEAGTQPQLVFPDTEAAEWLDCDQCRDCFKPALSLRPGQTAQYGAAVSGFGEPGPDGRPLRFRFGFIASTDNHAARPGPGYTQYARRVMTDGRGIVTESTERRVRRWLVGDPDDPRRPQPVEQSRLRSLFEREREASFMYPGGVVAVHAAGRDRRSLWDALVRREVYGTSGPRILLWFDLLNAPGGPAPMGSEVEMAGVPRFEVRAAGAFVEEPGCPPEARAALAPDRLHRLCLDECHNPGEVRHPITAIEVVRIRPQERPGEPVGPLIEDPWRRFDCPPDPTGCRALFEDPEHATVGRDAVYYVRALQEPTPAINGATLRTEFDAEGRALRVAPCSGSYRTPAGDDCLAPAQERAWSSPIYLDQPATRG